MGECSVAFHMGPSQHGTAPYACVGQLVQLGLASRGAELVGGARPSKGPSKTWPHPEPCTRSICRGRKQQGEGTVRGRRRRRVAAAAAAAAADSGSWGAAAAATTVATAGRCFLIRRPSSAPASKTSSGIAGRCPVTRPAQLTIAARENVERTLLQASEKELLTSSHTAWLAPEAPTPPIAGPRGAGLPRTSWLTVCRSLWYDARLLQGNKRQKYREHRVASQHRGPRSAAPAAAPAVALHPPAAPPLSSARTLQHNMYVCVH